jgi:CRP-like cAMP-binding protein
MTHTTLFDSLRQFGREMVAAPTEVILDANEPPQGAYLVTGGRVCVSLVTDGGLPVWSRIVGEGAILGITSALADELQTYRAVAVDTTEMAFIERDKLAKLVLDNSAIGIEILAFLSAEVSEVRRKWAMLLGKSNSRA